ncbi:MAG: valine--tRNA ligase [Clostridia bacterium]|nr:valine--tRNA ligase [Clostridia bacterium]
MLDKYNFKESESKWQEFWQKNKIYKYDFLSSKPTFSIDTPPPTVSGSIHIGHIFSYTQAEFVARYKRMTGFNVFYPFGFDNNGLPTERLVEKDKKIKAHQLSREEFRDICMEVAESYQQDFKNIFVKAGSSADWDLLYSTVNPEVQKTSQKSFLELAQNGCAYYGEKPAIWCPECRISIAQAELESKEIPSIFNYLKFAFADGNGALEIATTRPELLSACVCVFVNPNDSRYKKIIGKKVNVPLYNFQVEVLADEKVALDKGTGAVMCCTFGDETDLEWQQKHKLPIKTAIDDGGRMTELAGKYAGLKLKVAREEIIKDLKDQGYIFKQENIIHSVSTHERCGTPMEINIKKQWFIDLLNHKKEFLEYGEKINWYPDFMKSRYTNWVENIDRDWCISRQRYFGVPIPVWYCKNCGEIIFADESQLPVNPITDKPLHKCKCGSSEFIPEIDIFDTWQTSSITPLINAKWGEKNHLMSKIYPMSLRPNAHDIIRTWDFYTIVKSFYHTKQLPWQNVMISGFVMADKENKISKSKSNSKLSPKELIGEKSADVTRYWASTGSLGRDIVFSEEEFKNGAKLVNKLWNASKFVLSFLQDYKPKQTSLLPIDKWIIVKFNQMQKYFKNYFEKYEIGLAIGELERFFWNFCDNYIEIAKRRLYNPQIFGEDATESAKFASFNVLKEMLKLFAIYMPHITEEIYKDFFEKFEKEPSIHLTTITKIENNFEENIIQQGDDMVEVVTALRRYKSENNISLKEEIKKVVLSGYGEDIKQFESDIKAVGTVVEIEYKQAKDKQIEIIR